MKQNFACIDAPYIQNCLLGYHELLWSIIFLIDQLYLVKLQFESQENAKITLKIGLS